MATLPDSLKLENLRVWDHGLVHQVLSQAGNVPRQLSDQEKDEAMGQIVPAKPPSSGLQFGTFSGTAKALTEVFRRSEDRFQSFFDVLGIETSLPQESKGLEHQRSLYQWQPKSGTNADKYPPHLNLTPSGPPPPDNVSPLKIFNFMRLLDQGFVLAKIIPDEIKDFIFGFPDQAPQATMAGITARNQSLRAHKRNIYTEANIGDRNDWYSDEVFAQQAFTGANPATIEIASKDWAAKFRAAAAAAGNADMVHAIDSADKEFLYVQDYSYFRAAVGADPKAPMMVKGEKGADRYAVAPVTLFYLQPNGKLHPLAIVIDYLGSMEDSVVIFNKRLEASVGGIKSETKDPQETDWPWRFAKSCHMSADWIRHETVVHLTNTHLVEEVVIVAAHRSFEQDHLVYRCLQPHWLKTLALNAGARASLVPTAINRVIGLQPDSTYAFICDAYKRFNWTESYVPDDLERRGFPVKDIMSVDRFHNYGYGKAICLMWIALHKFVDAFLRNGGQGYTTDAQVARDASIQRWVSEMRSDEGGQMKSFPEIKTISQLVDAVTMCIHIASPQHTAVNYLQEYYQSFVVNKPPAICHAPPETLKQLLAYQEKDLMAALPINRPQEWLLASHLPHLLNSPVAVGQDLPTYAVSLYHLTGPTSDGGSGEPAIQAAAREFVEDLERFVDPLLGTGIFADIGAAIDDKNMPAYKVLYPNATAVSILI